MTNAIPEQHDLDWLHSTEASGATLEYLHFWGHSEPPRSAVGKACLSQWYPASFMIDGNRFSTAEHYMMFRKAELFSDSETAEQILSATNPAAVKALGRKVRGYQEALWEQHRVSIVVAGNHAKFSQSLALREFLVGTQHRVLVEASPVDRIWGIGLSADDPRANHPAQ